MSKVSKSKRRQNRTVSELSNITSDPSFNDECATISTTTTAHSLFSINTDYSAITADIFLTHTNHSISRSSERSISDDLIRKVLKYGIKEKISNKRCKYSFGDIQVITTGKKKDTAIVTTIRVFKAHINERLIGIVND